MRSVCVIVIPALLLSCGRKTRYCQCDITETGTKTSITSLAIPLVPAVGDTMVEHYVYQSTTVSEFQKVSKKHMRSACPVKTEEPIYDRTVSGVSNSALPGVPLAVSLLMTVENKGLRTRSCEITN
jgi:hypothetical protein